MGHGNFGAVHKKSNAQISNFVSFFFCRNQTAISPRHLINCARLAFATEALCEMTFENHPLQIVLPKPSKFQVTMWTSLTLQHLLRQGLERGPTSALRPHHINDPSTKPVSASGFASRTCCAVVENNRTQSGDRISTRAQLCRVADKLRCVTLSREPR